MTNQNPFRPGAGTLPPLLAGRDPELSLAGAKLDALDAGAPPSEGLLFFGPRGNGKTTLLERIAEDARERGFRVGTLLAEELADRAKLIRQLQEKTGLTRGRPRSILAAGFGLATEPSSPTEAAEKLVRQWITADPSPLVILLDEAHTVKPDAGRLFFNALQKATSARLPFLLLAAGTPDAPRRLRKAGTFTERALERVPVGRLARPETLRALAEPAKDSGRPMQAEATAYLASESQDDPYFVQLLGSAAWEAAETGEITMESARKGTGIASRRIERFYAERFGEAREREVAEVLVPLAAFLSERGGRAGELEFGKFLRGTSVDQSGLLTTLSVTNSVSRRTPTCGTSPCRSSSPKFRVVKAWNR